MIDLLSLSEELLCQIATFVSPDCLVDFALVNRRIFHCTAKALQKHGERWTKFHLLHDRNPLTIPSMLRSIMTEPSVAWYPRTLEVWDSREGFRMWKRPSFRAIRSSHDWDEAINREQKVILDDLDQEYPNLDSTFYSEEDIRLYRGLLRDLLHLKNNTVEKWLRRLEQGFDEPLKLLLIALSTELTTLRFAAYDTQSHDGPKYHPLRLFGASLRALQSLLPAIRWECFQSLKTVAVCVYTNLRHPHDAYYPHSRSIAPLLLLPKIEVLLFMLSMHEHTYADSDAEDAEDVLPANAGPYIWEWEPRRSTCKTMVFDCCEFACETTTSFIRACKNLEFFHTDTSGYDHDALMDHAKDSLTRSHFSKGSGLRQLSQLTALRHLDLEIECFLDLKASQLSNVTNNQRALQMIDSKAAGVGGRRDGEWADWSAILPPTLECLRLWSPRPDQLVSSEFEASVLQLRRLVEAIHRSESSNLQVICITDICKESFTDKKNLCDDLERLCVQNGIALHLDWDKHAPSWTGLECCELCRPPRYDVLECVPAIPND